MTFCYPNNGTQMYSHLWVLRLLLNKVSISQGALTGSSSAKRIQRVLDVLVVLGVINFFLLGMPSTLKCSSLLGFIWVILQHVIALLICMSFYAKIYSLKVFHLL